MLASPQQNLEADLINTSQTVFSCRGIAPPSGENTLRRYNLNLNLSSKDKKGFMQEILYITPSLQMEIMVCIVISMYKYVITVTQTISNEVKTQYKK